MLVEAGRALIPDGRFRLFCVDLDGQTIGARLIPAAEVALITLLEIVLGPLWVWLAYDERPSAATLAGGAIVVAAVVVQAVGGVPGGRSAASEAHV